MRSAGLLSALLYDEIPLTYLFGFRIFDPRLHSVDCRIQQRELFDFSVESAQRPSGVIMVGHENGRSGSDGAFPVPADKRTNRTKFDFYTETLGSPKLVVRIK